MNSQGAFQRAAESRISFQGSRASRLHSFPSAPQIGSVFRWGFTTSPAGFVQALTQLGFIVVQVNATGTPFRSKAFHDVWYGDMGDNGLIDHVHVIKQLAARRPELRERLPGLHGAQLLFVADQDDTGET